MDHEKMPKKAQHRDRKKKKHLDEWNNAWRHSNHEARRKQKLKRKAESETEEKKRQRAPQTGPLADGSSSPLVPLGSCFDFDFLVFYATTLQAGKIAKRCQKAIHGRKNKCARIMACGPAIKSNASID